MCLELYLSFHIFIQIELFASFQSSLKTAQNLGVFILFGGLMQS